MGLRRGLRRGRLPAVPVPVRGLVAGGRGGRRQRPGARARAPGGEPCRSPVPVRRLDDDLGADEGPPAATLAALHGPRLGVRAAIRLLVHSQGGRRPRQPPQRAGDARAGRARDGVPGGRQGNGQAVLRPLPAAALRARRLRRGCAPDPRADRAGGRRRFRGDLPEAGRCPRARPCARRPVRPDHADLPAAGATRPDPPAVEVANRVRGADRPLRPPARGGRRPRNRVRSLRAGARNDPGEPVREPGQAGRRAFI